MHPTTRYTTLTLALAAASAHAAPTPAFTIESVFESLDIVDGISLNGALPRTAINNSGDWVAPYLLVDGSGPAKVGIFGSQGLLTQPGEQFTLGDDAGLLTAFISDLELNNDGQFAVVAKIGPLTQPPTQQWGVFVGTTAVLKAFDQTSFDPTKSYPNSFEYMEFNDQGQVLVGTELGGRGNSDHNALVLASPTESGAYEDTPVALPGLEFPGGTFFDAYADVANGFALNNGGDVMFRSNGKYPGEPLDLFNGVFFNQALVADNEQEAPIKGTTYAFGGVEIALNNSGQRAFVAGLEGDGFDTEVILVDEQIAVSPLGLNLPGQSELPSVAALELDDSGNVIWSGTWVPPDSEVPVAGVFWNESLLFQTGSTTVDGLVLTEFWQSRMNVSDNGRWIVLHGELEDGSKNIFRVAIPAPGTAILPLLAATPLLTRSRRPILARYTSAQLVPDP